MQKNLYYRAMLGRSNVISEYFHALFLAFSSYPRLLLEVFIRKDFGQRYFKLSSAFTVFFILIIMPFLLNKFYPGHVNYGEVYRREFNNQRAPETPAGAFSFPHFLTWYLYLAAFVYFSIKRKQEIKRNPSVFDFAKYSRYSGKINPLFYTISLPGTKTNTRLVETLFEPALFFCAGILLCLFSQYLGYLLIVSSLFYSLGYSAAYRIGDNFIMDKIDEIICNQYLEKAFMEGGDGEDTKGVRFMGRVPAKPEIRQQLVPLLIEQEDEIIVAS